MRIMQISAFCGQGAPGKIELGLHNVLSKEGHQSIIAWGRANAAPDFVPTIRIGNKGDYYLHGLYTRLTDKCGFGSARATKDFIKKVDDWQPDLLQLHMLHGYFINLEVFFEYLAEKELPVVWTFHDEWAITGHCPCFEMIGCNKWMTGCDHCPQRSHHPASWLIDNSEWNWKKKKELFTSLEKLTIVAPSRWMVKTVQDSFLRDYPVKLIHNGINTGVFKPTQSNVKKRIGAADKKIILGVSSTWAPSKGLADFCELSTILPKEYQIVLVGLSDKQIRTLPDRMIGIRKTESQRELAELYTAAHAFVNPTYEDNYPTTNLEALACGTPVITYQTGGSVEAVEESGHGAVVSKGDIKALAEEIELITEQKQMTPLYQCGELEKYQEYILLYKEILGS